MYDYNLTAQELADFQADMMELAAERFFPTDEDMEMMMAEFYGEA